MNDLPQYSVNDSVWYLKDGKATESLILGVIAIFKPIAQHFPSLEGGEFSHFEYLLKKVTRTYEYTEWRRANAVFSSKEELIASL